MSLPLCTIFCGVSLILKYSTGDCAAEVSGPMESLIWKMPLTPLENKGDIARKEEIKVGAAMKSLHGI